MVHVSRRSSSRNASIVLSATRPIQPGELDEEDESVGFVVPKGANLVDADDPAIGQICSAAMALEEFGYDLSDPEVAARAIEVGRERYTSRAEELAEHQARSEAKEAERLAKLDGAVVYYMRIGNRVKIGWSTNVETRRLSINPEEIMVTEPGDHRLEGARHKQFRELRTHGEWFKLEDPLTGHIEMLRRHVDK